MSCGQDDDSCHVSTAAKKCRSLDAMWSYRDAYLLPSDWTLSEWMLTMGLLAVTSLTWWRLATRGLYTPPYIRRIRPTDERPALRFALLPTIVGIWLQASSTQLTLNATRGCIGFSFAWRPARQPRLRTSDRTLAMTSSSNNHRPARRSSSWSRVYCSVELRLISSPCNADLQVHGRDKHLLSDRNENKLVEKIDEATSERRNNQTVVIQRIWRTDWCNFQREFHRKHDKITKTNASYEHTRLPHKGAVNCSLGSTRSVI